ncbi:MAG: HEAT repeat domain-containing protein [Pirellula sp.]
MNPLVESAMFPPVSVPLTPQQQGTFQVLSARSNLASVEVLGLALDSPIESVRLAALQTLISRGGDHEMAKILEKIDHCKDAEIPLLIQQIPHLLAPIEAGLSSKNQFSQQRSLVAIEKLGVASQFHHLVNVAQSPQHPQQIVAAELVIILACRLGNQSRNALASKNDSAREQILVDLQRSMEQYHEHKIEQIFEAWLCASHWNDEAFKQLFNPDRRDSVAKMAWKQLRHSHRQEILDLLVGQLWGIGPSHAAIQLLGERKDHATSCRLADRAIKSGITPQLTKNLRLKIPIRVLEEFDFSSKSESIPRRCAMLQLLSISDTSPAKLLSSINAMLTEVHPKAESTCSTALRSLRSLTPEMIVMVLSDCFDAPDIEAYEPPPWKSELKAELERLIELYPVQPPSIRASIEFAFSDFQCESMSRHLEDWPEPHLVAYGRIVRIAQQRFIEYLESESESQSAVKRTRILKVIRLLGVDGELIEIVKDLLRDPNEAVRIEAIYTISSGRNRREAIELLQPLLFDEDNGVKVAADLILSQLGN